MSKSVKATRFVTAASVVNVHCLDSVHVSNIQRVELLVFALQCSSGEGSTGRGRIINGQMKREEEEINFFVFDL